MNKSKFQLWKSELISKSQPNNIVNGVIVNRNASFQKTMTLLTAKPQPSIQDDFSKKQTGIQRRDVLSVRFPLFDTKYPAVQRMSGAFDEKKIVNIQAGPKVLSEDIIKQLDELNVDLDRITTGPGSYTVQQLQDIARILGIAISGTKTQMVQRILTALGL